MSDRPIADVVARLRYDDGISTPTFGDLEAAADLIERLDALRPPCPTCGGNGVIDRSLPPHATPNHAECPDCIDGKVSWEQMAATWRAVWDDDIRDRVSIVGCSSVLIYLRSVKP